MFTSSWMGHLQNTHDCKELNWGLMDKITCVCMWFTHHCNNDLSYPISLYVDICFAFRCLNALASLCRITRRLFSLIWDVSTGLEAAVGQYAANSITLWKHEPCSGSSGTVEMKNICIFAFYHVCLCLLMEMFWTFTAAKAMLLIEAHVEMVIFSKLHY